MKDQADQPRILIVDDSPENIDVLGNALSEYKRQVALNGEKALKLAFSDNTPDLILLDVIMPGLDGYEVCRKLKENDRTRDVPVIFITVMGEEEDETKGLEIGAVDYITKPFSPPIVRARVRNHLQLKKAREELKQQNKELIEASQLREDVERITQHDLKSPLNPIISLSVLLLGDDTLSDRHKKLITLMRDYGNKMLGLINLSLDLFKMERGLYVCNAVPVDMVQMIRDIICNEMQIFITYRKIDIEIRIHDNPAKNEDKYFVMGEKLLCYSMMANLIKNAVEASPDGGKVTISLCDNEHADIRIHNRGAVPEGIRDRFFDKYVTARKEKGTGLGTYSARLIAVTQNGEINMATSEKDGTTITRPRGFGKSLTVSTLRCLFQGKKNLFDGLWIQGCRWEWKPHPVVLFDFNEISHDTPENLKLSLKEHVFDIARFHDIQLGPSSLLKSRFKELILSLHAKTGTSVVILIDEYDKPLIDHLGNGEDTLYSFQYPNREVRNSFLISPETEAINPFSCGCPVS